MGAGTKITIIGGGVTGYPAAIKAARMGAVLASFCVEQQGTQEHRVTPGEFWGRYQENFGAPPAAAGAF